jgi:hypothetical protein
MHRPTLTAPRRRFTDAVRTVRGKVADRQCVNVWSRAYDSCPCNARLDTGGQFDSLDVTC